MFSQSFGRIQSFRRQKQGLGGQDICSDILADSRSIDGNLGLGVKFCLGK